MMSSDAVWYWLIAGAVLMLAELVIPGGIVVFLGAACVVVAGAIWTGIVHGWVQSLTLWFITSIILLLSFRQITQRMMGGDSHVDNTDEELDIYNQQGQVKETIGPGEKTGRITFQGTDWPALGDGSVIPIGARVRIICRENIALVVEPLPDGE